MNHARVVAGQAMRFRIASLGGKDQIAASSLDLDEMAAQALAAAEPAVDAALHEIATTWIRAGLDPDALGQTWMGADAEMLFKKRPDLLDAVDEMIRIGTRTAVAA